MSEQSFLSSIIGIISLYQLQMFPIYLNWLRMKFFIVIINLLKTVKHVCKYHSLQQYQFSWNIVN